MNTADLIKKTALELFAAGGYEGTALSQIARTVGIKTPSIYAHFSSKEELYMAVLRDIVLKEMEKLQGIKKDSGEIERDIKALFYHLGDFAGKGEELLFYKRAVFFPPRSLDERIKKEIIHFEVLSGEMLKSILNLGMEKKVLKELNLDDVHSSFFCLLDGLFFEQHLYELDELLRRREQIWKFFWLSIKKES
ncbi:TetR/AcrR family transcriptional regulator [Peribacillus sp. SCS-26]|uniref:TetR/AcrR family transcriptional regulator n=1 Tax=Paraperibacillus marinus TaxID=3115295 RepID=UPI003906BD22